MADNYYCDCGEEGIVGIGTKDGLKYVCMDHFRDYLRGVRNNLDRGLSKRRED